MEVIEFLKKLATNSHHRVNINHLVNEMPHEFRQAYLSNDAEALKQQLSGCAYLANESHVVQVSR